jgi:hypothetical protein
MDNIKFINIKPEALYRIGLVFAEAVKRKDMELAKELAPVMRYFVNTLLSADQRPTLQMPAVTYFNNVIKDVKEDPSKVTIQTVDRLEQAHENETDAWYEMYKAEHERVKALERKVEELYASLRGDPIPVPTIHIEGWD